MAKLEKLTPELIEFIQHQKIFFVGTARKEGTVNISPKGMDTFRVIDANTALWLNLTGSGNETAAHLMESNRITIMFCAFDGKPMILRLYGTANTYHERDEFFQKNISKFPKLAGSRQIFEVKIELVQTSCGYAVPFMEYQEDRTILRAWAEKQGDEKIKQYWEDKNTISLDGHTTDIF